MKKRFSFGSLLHKDKLMMVVSLVLAVIIWVLVVYGQGHTQERVISGIPVSVTLDPYVSDKLKIRIVDGADATATVKVRGARSVIGPLTAQDISITADTKDVLKEGTYTIPIRVTSSGDYDILSLVGADGANPTVKITCDVIIEKSFAITSDSVELPRLIPADNSKYRFDAPSPSGAAIKEGQVTVSGSKSDVSRIARIAAVVPDELAISETTSFIANLVAYDENDLPIESVTFLNAEDGKVNVVVPVMEYHKEPLLLTIENAPSGAKELVSVSPEALELWAIPAALDDYLAAVRQQLVVDFDKEKADGAVVIHPVVLDKADGILLKTEEKPQITLDFSRYDHRTISIPLSADNVIVKNCPDGYNFALEQSVLLDVVICGEKSMIKKMTPEDLRVVIDAANYPAGHLVVKPRIESNVEGVWVFYGEDGYSLQISIIQSDQ